MSTAATLCRDERGRQGARLAGLDGWQWRKGEITVLSVHFSVVEKNLRQAGLNCWNSRT